MQNDRDIICCSYDEGDTWLTLSLSQWAEECADFFVCCEILSPFNISQKYASDPAISDTWGGGNLRFFWKPFLLSREQYQIICNYFLAHTLYKVKEVQEDRCIGTVSDLIMWKIEKRYGVPFEAQAELNLRYKQASQKMRKAQNEGRDYFNEWKCVNKITEEQDRLLSKYKDN